MKKNFILWLALVLSSSVTLAQINSPAHSSFSVKLGDIEHALPTSSAFVLPDEDLPIDVLQQGVYLTGQGGSFAPLGSRRWMWHTPSQTGLYPLVLTRQDTGEHMTINAFVMVPFDQVKGEYLNHYHIGRYPTGGHLYGHPMGYIEVTRKNEDTLLSPHFRLKQFLCKQPSSYPKYVVLREELLSKLEHTIELLHQLGYSASALHIMSGFRTPFYNRELGNVTFSRHMLGEAADVLMDGIAGKKGPLDAPTFYRMLQSEEDSGDGIIGGLGKYGSTAFHGPFVHIDVRGFNARWQG